jgi:hypothetical protein
VSRIAARRVPGGPFTAEPGADAGPGVAQRRRLIEYSQIRQHLRQSVSVGARWCQASYLSAGRGMSSHILLAVSLFTRRQAAREEAAARARGENVDVLRDEASPEFRQQLVYTISDTAMWPIGAEWLVTNFQRYLIGQIWHKLRVAYGKASLAGFPDKGDGDLARFIIEVATSGQVMDVIDMVIQIYITEGQEHAELAQCAYDATQKFLATMSGHMREHKLAFDIVEMQVVSKKSEELHQSVVAPALTLLHSSARFANAEKQYRDALDELAAGNWADAVTDASATVENVLRDILGLSQGALADLLGQARKQGLFGDAQSARIKKVVTGFTALADLRNEESDAHGNTTNPETAWLALHWAGALIVFLVQRAEAEGL